MPKMFDEVVWAGSESSLQAAFHAEEARVATLQAAAQWPTKTEERASRLLDVQHGLGIVQIKGHLNNDDDADWNNYIGATGYPEIRQALVEAAEHPDVKYIVLDIDSGGGAVSGVEDTAKFIRHINDNVKPVAAFTDGAAYSAAYWLASAAESVYATKSAGIGSIGVIATHMERSKQLAEMGIGVNVIRAGKYKALANSVEPLSEEGRAQIQAKVDASYKIFVDHVAEMRGKSYEYADTVMAQGREFTGQAAADAGLVDEITTFDAMVGKLISSIAASEKLMDTRAKQGSTLRVERQGDASMARKMLSEQEVAAIAAGVSLEASVSPQTAAPEQEQVVAEAEAPATEAAAEQAEAPVEETAEVDIAAQAVKFMKDQVKESQEALLAAQIKVSKLEDKLAALEAVVDPLKEIAAKATNNMRVALGGSVMDLSAVAPAQVIAEYASLNASFTEKFKVGGVAAVDAAVTEEKSQGFQMDSILAARINAVRGK